MCFQGIQPPRIDALLGAVVLRPQRLHALGPSHTCRTRKPRRPCLLPPPRHVPQILSLLSSHPNVAALLQTYEDDDAVGGMLAGRPH